MNEQVEKIVKEKLINKTLWKDRYEYMCNCCGAVKLDENNLFNHIRDHPSVISAIEAGIEIGIQKGKEISFEATQELNIERDKRNYAQGKKDGIAEADNEWEKSVISLGNLDNFRKVIEKLREGK